MAIVVPNNSQETFRKNMENHSVIYGVCDGCQKTCGIQFYSVTEYSWEFPFPNEYFMIKEYNYAVCSDECFSRACRCVIPTTICPEYCMGCKKEVGYEMVLGDDGFFHAHCKPFNIGFE